MNFDENLTKKMDQLDDTLDNLCLDLMNVSGINFNENNDFREAKQFLKEKMEKNIVQLLAELNSLD